MGRAAHAHQDDPGEDRRSRRGAPASRRRPRPDGRAPTGSRTSCSARPAPRSTTSGSRNEVKFTDPEIEDAFDAVGEILLEPGVRQRRLRRREEHQLHGVRRRRGPGRGRHLRADPPGVVPVGELPRRRERRWRDADRRPRRRRLRVRAPGYRRGRGRRSRSAASSSPAFSDDAATQRSLEYMSTPEWADARV